MTINQKAEQFVFDLFKDKLSSKYTYHNFSHTLRVVAAVERLAKAEKIETGQELALLLAAWFHDTGYIDGAQDHEARGIAILQDFAGKEKVEKETVALATELIRATDMNSNPQNVLEYIIRDADSSHFGKPDYVEIAELLREEWRITSGKTYSDLEWAMENRKMLTQNHRFFTAHARRKWQPQKDLNVAKIQDRIQEINAAAAKSEQQSATKKQKAEKDNRPERGIETMFRVTLHNHTQLSQIADSKANILLSVNAIIISIALSSLIPKLDSPGNAHLVVPTFIMLMFSVASIILAIMSTRPKISGGTFTRKDIEDRKINLLFFGNFFKVPLEEYQWAMNEMMTDRNYLYDSLVKDLYYLGLVLGRKYRLLRITYNIFMLGIIVSVLAFVIAFHRV